MRIWNRVSLRARLVIFYTILLMSCVSLVAAFSYWNIWELFVRDRASHLRARAKPIIEHWMEKTGLDKKYSWDLPFLSEEAKELARDLTSKESVAIVIDKRGNIVAKGKFLPEEPSSVPVEKKYLFRALGGENEVTYLTSVGGRSVVVVLIPLRIYPGSSHIFGVVQINSFLTKIRGILFRHGIMLIGLVSIVLLVGSLIGLWLIGINLKALNQLVITCNQISKGNLSKRVEVQQKNDEIVHLATSFNRMIDRIEAIFASQQRFVANSAHELLTPLTGIKGSLDVLFRGGQDEINTRNKLLKGVYGEVNRLIHLCHQLLTLSRLQSFSSAVQKEPVVLSKFLEELKIELHSIFKGQTLVVEEGPYVKIYADPILLKQIFLNLISNAWRYSSYSMPVTLGWRLCPKELEMWVEDRGEGMDREVISHIFERFYQGCTSQKFKYKGMGLGLSLTKAMVEAHGGRIWVESQKGKGSCFFFTLPLSK